MVWTHPHHPVSYFLSLLSACGRADILRTQISVGLFLKLFPNLLNLLYVVHTMYTRYRTIFLKRFIQGLVFKGILKGQESKSWDFFEGPRRFRGPQKSEKFNFSKRTNKSVDHKFKSFAINWPQISIYNLKFAQY